MRDRAQDASTSWVPVFWHFFKIYNLYVIGTVATTSITIALETPVTPLSRVIFILNPAPQDTTHLGPSWYVFFYINFFSLFTNNVYITPDVTNTTQGNNNVRNGLRTQMTHTYVPLGLWVSFFIVFISYFCFYCIIGYKYRTSSEMSTLQMSQFAHLISSCD